MELSAVRNPSKNNCTVSKVYVDGVYECLFLEDTVREIPGVPVEVWKVPGETAIPAGRYKLVIDMSTRFGHLMMHILNVPGFEGVRIHKGNSSKDTEGCPICGTSWDHENDWVRGSKTAYDALFSKVQSHLAGGGSVWITIA